MEEVIVCTKVNCANFISTRNVGDKALNDGKNLVLGEKSEKALEINLNSMPTSVGDATVPEDEKPSVYQRFRDTYRRYGKILIVVHLVTSACWFGIFYYVADSRVNVLPLLRWLNLSESIVHPFTHSHAGNTVLMYLLYKLATPVRYPVTILGTRLVARLLLRWRYLPQIPPENTLRSLVRDGRAHLRDKAKHTKNLTSKLKDEIKS